MPPFFICALTWLGSKHVQWYSGLILWKISKRTHGRQCAWTEACRAISLGLNPFQSLSLFPNQLSHGCHMHSSLVSPDYLCFALSHTHKTSSIKSPVPVKIPVWHCSALACLKMVQVLAGVPMASAEKQGILWVTFLYITNQQRRHSWSARNPNIKE